MTGLVSRSDKLAIAVVGCRRHCVKPSLATESDYLLEDASFLSQEISIVANDLAFRCSGWRRAHHCVSPFLIGCEMY